MSRIFDYPTWQLYQLEPTLPTIHANEYTYLKVGGLFRKEINESRVMIHSIVQKLKNILKKTDVQAFDIFYRLKSLSSIHEKMQKKNIQIDQIFDRHAMRIIVPSINDCYTVLKIINHHFTQLPEAFSNYIETPKSNGYQSIHLVVKNKNNEYLEIQIRTQEMHWEAEYGQAAHWRYKTNR